MIGTIGPGLTEAIVKEAFQPFGMLENVNIVTGKGIGFINYLQVESAVKARQVMNGKPLGGVTLVLKFGRAVGPPPTAGAGGILSSANLVSMCLAQAAVPTTPPEDMEKRKTIEKSAQVCCGCGCGVAGRCPATVGGRGGGAMVMSRFVLKGGKGGSEIQRVCAPKLAQKLLSFYKI